MYAEKCETRMVALWHLSRALYPINIMNIPLKQIKSPYIDALPQKKLEIS